MTKTSCSNYNSFKDYCQDIEKDAKKIRHLTKHLKWRDEKRIHGVIGEWEGAQYIRFIINVTLKQNSSTLVGYLHLYYTTFLFFNQCFYSKKLK